jgi:secreted Zn-dependent insulinase-like peptidase
MVHIYCKSNHEIHEELCPECAELLEYAKTRLDKCPFQEKKRHLWQVFTALLQALNERQSEKVMRYADPRVLLHHPLLAMRNVIDGRKEPEKLTIKPC